MNYWQDDKGVTNCGITAGIKLLLQPQKLILFWTKNEQDFENHRWLYYYVAIFQNISGV